MTSPNWRLILSPPADGAWNMALDESFLESVIAETQPPTLRFYAWDPACLSLGQAQPITSVDPKALEDRGWGLVRRPTGGRAILHTDELTYSICARQETPVMKGGVLESYRRISRALISGLAGLGILAAADSIYALPEGSVPQAAVCFEVPSNYEITANGRKLIGSAQARQNQSVLQHGSLPLFGDLSRIIDVLPFVDNSSRGHARVRLLEHAVTAGSILGSAPSWKAAVESMVTAFEHELEINLNRADPTPEEINRADQLVKEKYGNPAWTRRI